MDLNGLLTRAVELGATDVHLKVGQPPICRVDGDLIPMPDAPTFDHAELAAVLEIVAKRAPEKLQHFHDFGDLDIAYQDGELPRFRVNAYRQRSATSFAFRVIPKTVPSFEQLNMPEGVRRLAEEHRGLILVTGATGSGKTTTLAAIIDYMNRHRKQHIITIEDPIEILHPDRGCIVNQREVGLDTESFGQALRRALRQDPDTILIGELRDAETAQTALQAAESGHLVLSTLHTIDAAETVGRSSRRASESVPPMRRQRIRPRSTRRRPSPSPSSRRRPRSTPSSPNRDTVSASFPRGSRCAVSRRSRLSSPSPCSRAPRARTPSRSFPRRRLRFRA